MYLSVCVCACVCGSSGEVEERTTQAVAEPEQKADEESEAMKKTCPCCSEETDKDEKTTKKCSCRSESSASSEDSVISPDKVGLMVLCGAMDADGGYMRGDVLDIHPKITLL